MKHKTWGELLQVRSSSSLASNGTVSSRITVDDAGGTDEEEEQRERERETERRYLILHTVFICLASFACGMVTSQRGPSILALGHLVRTDLQHTASFFALGAGGQLAGCLATGVAFTRFRTPLLLFWALVGLCAATASLPWCKGFGIMATVYFIGLFFVGCVETSCYVDVAKRWGTQGGRILHLVQLAFIVGGVVSPALTQFFLTSKHYYTHRHNTSSINITDSTVTVSSRAFPLQTNLSGYPGADSFYGEDYVLNIAAFREDGRVVYAYMITAAVASAAAVPFIVGRLFKKLNVEVRNIDVKKRPRHRERTSKVLPVLVGIGVFFFAVSGVEESFHQFIAAFLVEDLHWVPTATALVTSWFWCGVLLVRLSSLLMPSSVVGEDQGVTLALSCTLLPASLFALHLASGYGSKDGVWACVFFTGMSSSLVFPASFTWIHSAFPVVSPGAMSAVIMLSTALVGVINPVILGGFFQHRIAGSKSGRGGFCFLLLAEAVLALLALIVLRVIADRPKSSPKRRTKKKSGKMEEEDSYDEDEIVLEINVPPPRFDDVHEPVDIEDKET